MAFADFDNADFGAVHRRCNESGSEAATTVDYIGPSRTNGYSITRKRAVMLPGTAFRTVVFVPESQFKLHSGSLKTYVKVADSGNKRAIMFCPECGTQIYATSVDGDERILGLRIGTAHQRAELPPKKQYWCRSALDWVANLDAIEQVE
jgi:hypothetical protein